MNEPISSAIVPPIGKPIMGPAVAVPAVAVPAVAVPAVAVPAVAVSVQVLGKMPTRATPEAAGLDLYARTDMTVGFKSSVRVPVGIKTVFPPGFYFQIQDKSGLASKGITRRAGVIDSDYREEWEVVVVNETNSDYIIKAGEKVAQAILLELPSVKLIEVNAVDFEKASTSNRGGGFGSTGK